MKLENSLRGALLREELELHYQPIVDLQSGSVVAMEALARWRHAELGNVPPDQFIPIAEETGAIVEIGEWVMRTACRQTRAWREAGYPNLKVAVNISAVQFASESLCDSIAAILRESGMPPAALELEITEGVAMKDAASSVSILKSIRNLGVKIAIDDFGTGFSALSYLRRFPIDIIKIDKMFVRAMLGQKEDAAIVRAIIGLGEQLGLTLHAEGVESVEQNDLLMTLGCHRAQGFEIARPMAASDVPAFLAARKGESAAAKVRVCRC
jgi:EAL domain-containing protein (putative c-di-GMP-specific phosphodiesterase class I)